MRTVNFYSSFRQLFSVRTAESPKVLELQRADGGCVPALSVGRIKKIVILKRKLSLLAVAGLH